MTARAEGNWQGMNWIRQDKRLAIYMRDGCACVWCGATVEQGTQLTLDHLVPHSKGGTNEAYNLVTACKRCNDSRGARSTVAFSRAVAQYVNNGVQAEDILKHVRRTSARSLVKHRVMAARVIAQRGSVFKALYEKEVQPC